MKKKSCLIGCGSILIIFAIIIVFFYMILMGKRDDILPEKEDYEFIKESFEVFGITTKDNFEIQKMAFETVLTSQHMNYYIKISKKEKEKLLRRFVKNLFYLTRN